MNTARIFSIEEFSLYDGPGIRATVFLKGCPLCCTWCHNPEGQCANAEPVRNPNSDSFRICGEELIPEELFARLAKLLPLLNANGGGITFSGGEPLASHEFLYELLTLLRGKNHRALQTCGYASAEVFGKILTECDYVLYDLKLMDDTLHRKYTGVSNEQILQNYKILAKCGIPFITRVPLIPTVSDTKENLTATAEFMRQNGVHQIELLPYHITAGAKYKLLGRDYEPNFDTTVTPNPHLEIFESYGIEVRIL